MSWLLSIILGALPDLWIIAALGAGALWAMAWWQPGRLSAEVVRIGSLVLLGVAVYLWTWAEATAAYETRVAADREKERVRVEALTDASAAEARLEATLARSEREVTDARREAEVAALPPDQPPKLTGYGGGLSPTSAAAITRIIGGY